MRFAAAHKFTSYMMMMCAYLALVLSGELPEVSVLISFSAIVVSWFWEAPRIRFDRYAKMWTALSVMVFAYSVLSALSGGDILIVGSQFLIYLTINKLFNRRACKDYQQVYVLSFLMLVAGTVLNTQFTFGIFFLGFVVSSTWALILFHLRREMEDNFLLKHSGDHESERVQVGRILNSRRIVGKPFFIGTSMVSLSIFLGATLLFLMIPRIGFGLFFQKNRSAVHMTGFSDGVQLGAHGVIKNDDTVVMRVQVGDSYQGRDAPYIHWRGVAFDRYERGQWLRSRAAPLTKRRVTMPRRGHTRHHLLYTEVGVDDDELDSRLARAVRQEIYLEPTGYDVLFGASKPTAFEFESRWSKPRKERNDEIRYPHSAGIKYIVYSDVRTPPASALRAASDSVPGEFEVYLDVPAEIPERVHELARDITATAKTRYDKVKAIEQWLKNNLSYTLRMEDPGTKDPVDFFLFERKKGHCEYFSSAMAIMVRSIGAPSRNVNGFLGGEWNEYNDYIAVRAGDAHSWVEVYFDDVGWVTFDPTPSASIDQLGRGGGGVLDRLRRLADTVRFKWFKWVIEYDLYRQLSLFRSLSSGLKRGARGVFKAGPERIKKWIQKNKKTAILIFASIVGLGLGLSMLRRRKRGDTEDGRPTRSRRRRSAVARIYSAASARVSKYGHRRSATTTPREHAAKLIEQDVPGSDALAKLAELYYGVEFGGRSADEALPEARDLRLAIDEALRGQKKARRAAAK